MRRTRLIRMRSLSSNQLPDALWKTMRKAARSQWQLLSGDGSIRSRDFLLFPFYAFAIFLSFIVYALYGGFVNSFMRNDDADKRGWSPFRLHPRHLLPVFLILPSRTSSRCISYKPSPRLSSGKPACGNNISYSSSGSLPFRSSSLHSSP